jgi:hypothetical protein
MHTLRQSRLHFLRELLRYTLSRLSCVAGISGVSCRVSCAITHYTHIYMYVSIGKTHQYIYVCRVDCIGVILCNADMTVWGGVCRICHGARRRRVAYTPHHTHASIHGARLVSATHAAHTYIDTSPAVLRSSPAVLRSSIAPDRATHRRACALDENAGMAKTKGAGRCRRPLTRKFTFHAQKKTPIASHGHSTASHGHSTSSSTCMVNKNTHPTRCAVPDGI